MEQNVSVMSADKYTGFVARVHHMTKQIIATLKQCGHSPVIIKFPGFSRHFKWIFTEYRHTQE